MKLVWAACCFIFVFVSFISEAHSSLVQDPELVRVRLLSVAQKIQISGIGLRFQNIDQNYRQVAIPNSSQAEVRLLNKNGKNIWALRLGNQEPERLFTQKFLMIQGEGLRIGAQTLPSRVLLSVNKQKVDVIGVMPLDEYIVGVLASEMPLSWPLETLKAQAVAARSYALAVKSERKNRAYHLESNVLDQVFRHVVAEDESSPLIKKALQAVRETKGLRLYAANGEVLKAFFHSDCGGRTTSPRNVWDHGVNAGVAVDSSCPTNPRGQWKLELTKEELQKRLGVSEIAHLEFVHAPSEKRIKAVRIALNQGSEKIISANNFRQMLGFQDLRSSLFEMKKIGETYLFEGRGFGHGVGLCQWGSRTLGQQGMSFTKILKHYYPLARLK
ncbi:SpoIID/LytB domain-containing protein [Bdellovibrio sp. 22V]|uniref:SpoIID/LytB domain-containing protein n=1 Tax=Bdellovibrio TaxID=958 RepID=UPI002542C23F|nr:SpoIID/LytB domain-containing protein [Bdellovibrio sp. 22V]WII71645.1 SpoIID/LytB domain-containing protein [Bdellovibrio sp. 22V]